MRVLAKSIVCRPRLDIGGVVTSRLSNGSLHALDNLKIKGFSADQLFICLLQYFS